MSNEKTIWDFFLEKGATSAGVAGLMGNLYAESHLRSNNLQDIFNSSLGMTDEEYTSAMDSGVYQNFVADGACYGIAQWKGSRLEKLRQYTQEKGLSVGNLTGQLGFLWQELSESYQDVQKILCTTEDVTEASNTVLIFYERPSDQSGAVLEKRASLGEGYYEKYGGGNVMSESSLASKFIQSPNKSDRLANISKIAVHCMAGNMTAESCGNFFGKVATQASSHYGIGSDGDICQYVLESDRAWCTGGTKTLNGLKGSNIDHMAVTIEVANCGGEPDWAVSDTAFAALCDLVEDIARRNHIYPVTFEENGSGVLQAHRWYTAKACPGDYLYGKFAELAQIVTARLKPECDPDPVVANVETVSWWAEESVDWVKSNGLMVGDDDGKFRPQDSVVREELSVILKVFFEKVESCFRG